MADETKPATVKVESIKQHSYMGKDYPVGATYDADEQYVQSLAAQGMAIRVDRVAHAKAEAKAAENNPKQQPPTMAVAATTVKPARPAKAPKAPAPAKVQAKAKAAKK